MIALKPYLYKMNETLACRALIKRSGDRVKCAKCESFNSLYKEN